MGKTLSLDDFDLPDVAPPTVGLDFFTFADSPADDESPIASTVSFEPGDDPNALDPKASLDRADFESRIPEYAAREQELARRKLVEQWRTSDDPADRLKWLQSPESQLLGTYGEDSTLLTRMPRQAKSQIEDFFMNVLGRVGLIDVDVDEYNRRRSYERFVDSTGDYQSVLPETVARAVRQGGTSALASAPVGLAGGAGSLIAQHSITSASQSYTDAIDAGLDESAATKHALLMGAIEGGVTYLFGKFGMGGQESLYSTRAAGVQKFVRGLASELAEENIIAAGQMVTEKLNEVQDLSGDEAINQFLDTSLATVVGMGATNGVRSLGEFIANPSRRTAKAANLPEEYISGKGAKQNRQDLAAAAAYFNQQAANQRAKMGEKSQPLADAIRQPATETTQTTETSAELPPEQAQEALETQSENIPPPETPPEAEFEQPPEAESEPAGSQEPAASLDPDAFPDDSEAASEQPFSRVENNSGKRSPLELQNPAEVFSGLLEGDLVSDEGLETLREFATGDVDSFEGVINEAIKRSNQHNDNIVELRSEFRERFGDDHSALARRARLIHKRGGDPTSLTHFDEIVDELRSRPESALYLQADELGNGDLEAGLWEVLQGGISQYQKTQPEAFLDELLDEAGAYGDTSFDFGKNADEDGPEPPPQSPKVPEESFENNPKHMAAKNAVTEFQRMLMGGDPYPSVETVSMKKQMDAAIEEGLDQEAGEIAAMVKANPQLLNAKQQAAIVVRLMQLKNNHNQILEQVEQTKDPGSLRGLEASRQAAEAEFMELTEALKLAGTEIARALAQRRLTIDDKFDVLTILTRAKAKKGGELDSNTRQVLEEMAKKNQTLTEEIEKLRAKVDEQTAMAALNSAFKQRGKRGPRKAKLQAEQLAERARMLLEAGCGV